MHGYEANAMLEVRKVRDWAGVSRPQIYYSLEKLAGLGLLEATDNETEKAAGPERRIFDTTKRGRTALASALEREDWAQQIELPPFLTWLALSWQCQPGVFSKQLRRRREFLKRTLDLYPVEAFSQKEPDLEEIYIDAVRNAGLEETRTIE